MTKKRWLLGKGDTKILVILNWNTLKIAISKPDLLEAGFKVNQSYIHLSKSKSSLTIIYYVFFKFMRFITLINEIEYLLLRFKPVFEEKKILNLILKKHIC